MKTIIYIDNMEQYWILPKRTKINKIMKLKVWDTYKEKYIKKNVFVKVVETYNEIHIKVIENLEDRDYE